MRTTRARPHAALAAAALTATVLIVLGTGCVERRSPVDIRAHPPEWNLVGSVDFHGTRVVRDGPSECAACHAADLRGAPGVQGCDDCHAGAGGHPFGWNEPSSSDFHGLTVAAKGPGACGTCHGDDYAGGWSGVSCSECHAGGPSGHPDGWMNRASSSFHGLKVYFEGVENCTRCHGFGLGGGTSGIACAQCHGVVVRNHSGDDRVPASN